MISGRFVPRKVKAVDAFRLIFSGDTNYCVYEACMYFGDEYLITDTRYGAMIDTPAGFVSIKSGDWIVKDEDGTFNVYADENFNEKYVEVRKIKPSKLTEEELKLLKELENEE